MIDKLTILYRGSLKSCNFRCNYCPLLLEGDSHHVLENDKQEVEKFVQWVAVSGIAEINVFFTPYGEVLIHETYQNAIAELTDMKNIKKTAIQTNLSKKPEWISQCRTDKLGLWCSYHPDWISMDEFLDHCQALKQHNITFSVGMVGIKENIPAIEKMRKALPKDIYLWINAYKRRPDYYTESERRRLEATDRLFPVSNRTYKSKGKACSCGESVIAVAGDGDYKRCHFSDETLGNIYKMSFEKPLSYSICPENECRCHIGYVHLKALNLKTVYGNGILERVPDAVF